MPFTLTITADTPDQLIHDLVGLTSSWAGAAADIDNAPATEDKPAPKKTTKTAQKKKAEPKAEEKAPEKAPEPKAEEKAAPLDFDKEVAPLVVELVTTKGREVVENLLEEYGVSRASQVEEDQLPEFLAKVKELLD